MRAIVADDRTVVSLCDASGVFVRPWRAAGFRCVCVDLAFRPGVELRDGVECVGGDVRDLPGIRGRPCVVAAWPPCTDLASVGSHAWAAKGRDALRAAVGVVDCCVRLAVRSRAWAWLVENPRGRLSHFLGPPDHCFHPCDYGGYLSGGGDAYTKKTGLWVGGSFAMPTPRPVPAVEGSLCGEVENVRRRSETPRGFALAAAMTLQAAMVSDGTFPPGCACLDGSWESSRAPELFRAGEPLRPPDVRPCGWCGRDLSGRVDRTYCTTRCRVAAFRGRRGPPRLFGPPGIGLDAAGRGEPFSSGEPLQPANLLRAIDV